MSPLALSLPRVLAAALLSLTATQGYHDGALLRENFKSGNSLITHEDVIRNSDQKNVKVIYKREHFKFKGRPVAVKHLRKNVAVVTVSFDFFLDKHFDFAQGGIMHGIKGGLGHSTECRGVAGNGWSARVAWTDQGRLRTYTYHQDPKGKSDKRTSCGEFDTSHEVEHVDVVRNEWHRVDLQVSLNSKNTAKDGRVTLYLDGVMVADHPHLRLAADLRAAQIDWFTFDTYYGIDGQVAEHSFDAAPSEKTLAIFDNFSVFGDLRVTGLQGSQCEIDLHGIFSKGGACCPERCSACGGYGCGGSCCFSVVSRGWDCDSVSNAPCFFKKERNRDDCENKRHGIFQSIEFTEPCKEGKGCGSHGPSICCPKSCGGCGGRNCSRRPGGLKCCYSFVSSSESPKCEGHNKAPCKY